jgi:acetyltransferase-like isoleucine patch superfamily enzyme
VIRILKQIYFNFRLGYNKIQFFFSINWLKTFYFNFKMFPFDIAKHLPVYFYGPVKLSYLSGSVHIDAPIKRGMIGFGQHYEKGTLSKGIAEVSIGGKVKFNGYMQFGKDCFFSVSDNAICEFGHMASLGTDGKLICTNSIKLGDYARIGSESQIIDTNFHQMLNSVTGEKFPISSPIEIGSYNFIGFRVSIMSKTITPNYCTVASNSICNKDYRSLGENILIGGMPAKFLKENICRDWKGEHEILKKYLMIN